MAKFNGEPILDGIFPLREGDRRIRLLDGFPKCFRDGRDPELIEHAVQQSVARH